MNKTDNITLLRGDCLEILPTIADCSCDMALVDLPYGCLNKGNKHDAMLLAMPLPAQLPRVSRLQAQK